MSMFRSESMNLCKLLVTKDKAYDVVEALGLLNEVSFVNLNKDEQPQKLPYCHEISKCNEICTKLDYIYEQCQKFGVKVEECESYQEFIDKKTSLQMRMKMSKFTILDHLNKIVEEQQKFLKEQNERIESMYSDYNDLLEYKQVTIASQELMERDEMKDMAERISVQSEYSGIHDREEMMKLVEDQSFSEAPSEINISLDNGVKIGKIIGTCLNDDLMRLKTLLFRSTRGNALVLTKNTGGIETYDKKIIPKSVFIVVFQEGEILRSRIETICSNFSKNHFVVPKNGEESKLKYLEDKIEQTRQLIVMSLVGIEKYLMSCTQERQLDLFRKVCQYDHQIYMRLDYLHLSENLFTGYFWS